MVPEPRGVYQEDENKKNITHSSDEHKLSRQNSLRIREYEFELKLSDLPINRKESRCSGPEVGINVGQKGRIRMLENTSGLTQLTTGHRSWLLVF